MGRVYSRVGVKGAVMIGCRRRTQKTVCTRGVVSTEQRAHNTKSFWYLVSAGSGISKQTTKVRENTRAHKPRCGAEFV